MWLVYLLVGWMIGFVSAFALIYLKGERVFVDERVCTHRETREMTKEEIKRMDKAFDHFDEAMDSMNKAFGEFRNIPNKRRKRNETKT